MIQLGIDLGTTNTTLAIGGQTQTLRNGGSYLPSVVAFPPSGDALVGQPARRRRAIDPQNTIAASKRLIGRGWNSAEVKAFQKRYTAFELIEIDQKVAFKTRAGAFGPVEIASRIVTEAIQDIGESEQFQAVVTVPASFLQDQRSATIQAVRGAGIEHVVVIEEPTATAAAYSSRGAQGLCAVYDLGGGTFDFAILDCSQTPLRVIETGGDPFLGGDDIDLALAQWAATQLLETHNWDLRSDVAVYDRLVVECERAKIRLSHAPKSSIDLTQVDPAAPVTSKLSIERPVLERLALELVQRTFLVCDEVLHRAGIRAERLNAVFMAGGAASSPMVWSAAREYFGSAPRCEFAPMEVVAIGASIAPIARA